MTEPLLSLRNITKAFGAKVANDKLSLDIHAGRIHAIIGENGAGKSTLMSMINGTAAPDSGEIMFDGKPVRIPSPRRAHELGIGMVFQHFKLVGSLTVAANVFLGRELAGGMGSLNSRAMEAKVRELSEKFGLNVDPRALTRSLSVGEAQRVEVLKALSHDTRLLILDEPTAVLTPSETDDLFVVIRDLAKQGCAVVFISHKLDEVLQIADEITVIRDGQSIATVPATGLTKTDIARMMVGREVLLRITHTAPNPQHEVLAVNELTIVGERGLVAVDHLSLSVRAGEIVGIAGVEGNGQSELTAAIAGMLEANSGSVVLSGRDMTRASIATRRAAGLAYIPEDRHFVGTAPSMSVAENAAATHLRTPISRAFGRLDVTAMRDFAETLIDRFDIRGANATTPVSTLSGGNMQKVVIAREFEADPAILVVAQPTRGVDVGAMEFVHNAIVSMRDRGAGVLLISADLNEAMSLSDRLLVMHRGKVMAEFTQETMSEAAVGLAMAGVAPDAETISQAQQAHRHIAEQLAQSAQQETPDERPIDATATHALKSSEASALARSEPKPAARTRSQVILERILTNAGQPILAILAALLIGAGIIAALGRNPLSAFGELFFSSFASPQGVGALIAQSVPLLVLSAAVIISFRAGFFNIGGEGQMYLGSLSAALVGVAGRDVLPGPLLALLMLVVGFAVGAFWGFIPGGLFAAWKVDIIVTTLMMSTIAIQLTMYLITGPFQDPQAGTPASKPIDPHAMLPIFLPAYSLGLDLVIALTVVLVLGLVLTRTKWGLRVRELGEMNRFAEYTGVSPKVMSVQVMTLAGGVSGLAGALFVLGPNGGRFLQNFSPGYGFLAITVALLARLNPWSAVVASFFYANMMAGAQSMQINADVPFPMVTVLQGLVILLITGSYAWKRRAAQRIESSDSSDESPTRAGSAQFHPESLVAERGNA